ncbi:MAG TPA: hypothetical protein VJ874_00865, partial [Candidatus Thermoplasmatota archaeon]|nr:hypothetical protein [Candidatus Thermoplasmatota archaeon]
MPRRDQGHHRGDAAVGSSVVAFLVAGALFMASVVAVLVTTQTGSDSDATGDAPDSAAFQVQAKGLADLLMGSPGYAVCPTASSSSSSSSSSLTCTPGAREFATGVSIVGSTGKLADADSVTRLGLLDPDSNEP